MRFTKVEYDAHATDQMIQRRISRNQVVATLERPDREGPGHTAPRIVAERVTSAGNTIRVVYVTLDGGRTAYVITVIRVAP
jgi:hypothetical protein